MGQRRDRAERPAGDGADVLLELVDLAAVQRPVAGVVHPGRDLVDQQPAVLQLEQLDPDHADIVERWSGCGAAIVSAWSSARRRPRAGGAGAAQDAALVMVLGQGIGDDRRRRGRARRSPTARARSRPAPRGSPGARPMRSKAAAASAWPRPRSGPCRHSPRAAVFSRAGAPSRSSAAHDVLGAVDGREGARSARRRR